MRWALVIYFLTSHGWSSAESLNYSGWYKVFYENESVCRKYEEKFNLNINRHDIIGVCKFEKINNNLLNVSPKKKG